MPSKRIQLAIVLIILINLALNLPVQSGEPTGAKALFHSGEGASFRTSGSGAAEVVKKPTAPKEEKYVGISYQLVKLYPDGQFKAVPKSHVFANGDRVKFLVRTNRPGYLTILNVGTSGNTNVIYSNYVQAFAITEIPPAGNLQFVGPPGSEKIIMMLSNGPNPLGTPPAGQGQTYAAAVYRSLEGSKDLVLEDNLQTKYAIISPQNNYRPIKQGIKDLILESDAATGSHYGVVPLSTLQGGGILTLETTLRHR